MILIPEKMSYKHRITNTVVLPLGGVCEFTWTPRSAGSGCPGAELSLPTLRVLPCSESCDLVLWLFSYCSVPDKLFPPSLELVTSKNVFWTKWSVRLVTLHKTYLEIFAACPATFSSGIKERMLVLLILAFGGQGVICFVSRFCVWLCP